MSTPGYSTKAPQRSEIPNLPHQKSRLCADFFCIADSRRDGQLPVAQKPAIDDRLGEIGRLMTLRRTRCDRARADAIKVAEGTRRWFRQAARVPQPEYSLEPVEAPSWPCQMQLQIYDAAFSQPWMEMLSFCRKFGPKTVRRHDPCSAIDLRKQLNPGWLGRLPDSP